MCQAGETEITAPSGTFNRDHSLPARVGCWKRNCHTLWRIGQGKDRRDIAARADPNSSTRGTGGLPDRHLTQNIKGNTIDDFRDTKTEVIVYPPQFKSGEVIYPYEKAIAK